MVKDDANVLALAVLMSCALVTAQFDNYHNWPDPEVSPPVVKTALHAAGKDTRIRCQIQERFRHIQNGLNLTWEFKACRAGHAAACMRGGHWTPLCGGRHKLCPPILTLLEPRASESGLYRCHITFDSSVIILNVYMLEFTDKRREPPVIVGGMDSNITVVAPLVAVLQCKVRSPVVPTVRWFRRLQSSGASAPLPSQNLVQYLNNTYQLVPCCPVAPLSQKDLYLSKLVLTSSSVLDSGFYVCLAINDVNYTHREAYISVLPVLRMPNHKAETESFLGLFLIPVGLAMVPTMAWMMCIRQRKLIALESPVEHQLPTTETKGQHKPQDLGIPQTHRSSTCTCPPVAVTMTHP